MIQNILSIDLEDWYQVQSYKNEINVSDWDSLEGKLAENTLEILNILRMLNINATFFVLAYNAKRYPDIIRLIKKESHEIGLHGFYHNSVYNQTPDEFKYEISYSKRLIEDICQAEIIGFRAPNWSITPSCLWALDILSELGFCYDSSMDEGAFKKVYSKIPKELLEIPRSNFIFFSRSIPFAGGFFLRAYPYFFTKKLIKKNNERGNKVVVYMHPWEMDADPLPIRLPFYKKIPTSYNLELTKDIFHSLLQDFNFNSIQNIFFKNKAQ